jgi:tyrosine aminotransferase
MMNGKVWNIKLSEYGEKTENILVSASEKETIVGNPEKSKITMRVGDPSIFGNFPPHPDVYKAIAEAAYRDKFTYAGSRGYLHAREAVAHYAKHMGNVTADDVFLTSGCSMAVEWCLKALANPGENVLIPRPSWHYLTYIAGMNIEGRFYNLDPDDDWQIDLKQMESLIDDKTRAIVVNSPGNPSGNVFSKQHIWDIIKIAERHRIPIVSDETYEFFTFGDAVHYSFATLSENVPVLG